MSATTTPAGAASAAPAGDETKAAESTGDTRPKPSAAVLKTARTLGEVIVHPTREDVTKNPNARGYDEAGRLRPADARAVYLVVPKPVKAAADPTATDRGKALRKVRVEAAKAREKAEKGKG